MYCTQVRPSVNLVCMYCTGTGSGSGSSNK